MTSSDGGFSPVQNHDNMFFISPLRMEETGFHATYDRPPMRPEKRDTDDAPENESQLSDDDASQQIADAYAQGYLNGQQAAMVQHDEVSANHDALASAINRLKTIDEGRLSRQLWGTVLSLFEQAVGHARTNKKLLQERCDAAIKALAADVGEVCLYVAAADAKLLQNHDCPVAVLPDEALLPGSVRLVHGSGQIAAGSTAMADEMGSRARLDGGAAC